MLLLCKDALTSLHLSVNLPCVAKDEILNVESLQFNLAPIRNATDNFSDSNKLGQGGFGVVYKVIKHYHNKKKKSQLKLLNSFRLDLKCLGYYTLL